MPKIIDYTGRKIGKLTVLRRECQNKHKQYMYLCRCDCGTEILATSSNIKRGQGCKHCRRNNLRHGLYYTRLHRIWTNMKSRCYNPKTNRYHRYGARGITVCNEWLNDFKVFYDWAMNNGYNDSLTIDRIDNDKGYSPDNCRWATPKEQAKTISHSKRGKYNKMRSYNQ